MSASKTIILTVVILLSIATVSFSQTESKKEKRNLIELYFPICHFFDPTKTNWLIFDKTRSGLKYDQDGNFIGYKYTIFLPYTYGIKYERKIGKKSYSYLHALSFYRDYGYDRDKEPGEVIERQFNLYSFGYNYLVNQKNEISLRILGEFNIRKGAEALHIFYPNPWEGWVEGLLLNDIGLTLGMRSEFSLLYNFLLSGEAKYMYMIYRGDEGISFFDDFKRASAHTFTLQFGLGYRF